MTNVYFIRHAQADNTILDGRVRPLTQKGLADRTLVTAFLHDKNINAVISSPFKRAIDTIAPFAEKHGFEIEIVEELRERKSDSDMRKESTNFVAFMQRQWADFSYTFSDGECLFAVQRRNIAALHEILCKHHNKNIVIGTHGTALLTILHFYFPSYGFDTFMAMVDIQPWVAKMTFDDLICTELETIDLFA